MEEILNKAKSVGYVTPWGSASYPELAFLDAKLFQALGKACNWDDKDHCPCCGDTVEGTIQND